MPTTSSLKDLLGGVVEDDHTRLAILDDLGRQREDTPPATRRIGSRYATLPRPLELAEFPITHSRVHHKRCHLHRVCRKLAEQQLLLLLIERIRLASAMPGLHKNLWCPLEPGQVGPRKTPYGCCQSKNTSSQCNLLIECPDRKKPSCCPVASEGVVVDSIKR